MDDESAAADDGDEGCSCCYDSRELMVGDQGRRLLPVSPSTTLIDSVDKNL